jgi:hypothetical protein
MRLRNGYDESTAPIADKAHLGADLILQVPGQDEHVVRPGIADLIRRENGNMRARRVFALLVRVAIDRVVDEIGTDAAIVEQRIAFARRAVADKGFAVALRLDQEARQFALVRANPIGEIRIGPNPVQTGLALTDARHAVLTLGQLQRGNSRCQPAPCPNNG